MRTKHVRAHGELAVGAAGSTASYFDRSFSVKSVVFAFGVNVARTTPEIASP